MTSRSLTGGSQALISGDHEWILRDGGGRPTTRGARYLRLTRRGRRGRARIKGTGPHGEARTRRQTREIKGANSTGQALGKGLLSKGTPKRAFGSRDAERNDETGRQQGSPVEGAATGMELDSRETFVFV